MQIGKFKATTLEFGRFKLDGGAMFGVVPKALWAKKHPADESNKIDMALRCLLIEVEDRKILVDTGFGANRAEKFRQIYSFTGTDNYLEDALSKINLTPDDITDVLVTHLHFDHVGGATKNKDTEPVPSFPNAKYYIQKVQLDHARERMERDRASYFPNDFEPLIEQGVAVIVDGEWELLPGLKMLIVNGHTPAQQLPMIQDAGQILIYAADLLPFASQFSLPWIMSYDLYPVTTLNEKKEILTKAIAENWNFVFEHDPTHVFGKPFWTGKDYTLAE